MEAKVFAKYMLASKAEGCHITPHKDTTQTRQKYICFEEEEINPKYLEKIVKS